MNVCVTKILHPVNRKLDIGSYVKMFISMRATLSNSSFSSSGPQMTVSVEPAKTETRKISAGTLRACQLCRTTIITDTELKHLC